MAIKYMPNFKNLNSNASENLQYCRIINEIKDEICKSVVECRERLLRYNALERLKDEFKEKSI
jgi:hypothetical protein